MHELGIVFHIIDSVEAVAKENGISSVKNVVVELGEVSSVIPEYLIDCWNWAVKKKSTVLSDCTMSVETIHAVTHCSECEQDYATVEHGKICPFCGSEKTWLITGNEINIKEIAVPENDGESE
ncbi:MAG: hydrogenase maturation nickel metallochaperone HypA [Eubacteriales bacterium]